MRPALCALIVLLLLAACARPLTRAETDFAATLFGDGLNPAPVRVHRGALIGTIPLRRPARPARACRERIRPPETGIVSGNYAAVVLGNRMFYARRLWQADMLADYPDTVQLEDAMLLGHELTHVWQWQNRARTGYHPVRAASEHRPGGDPYLFDLSAAAAFDDFTFEQQGALVEEFVCCRALDPEGARTQRLYDLIRVRIPQIRRHSPIPADGIALFWSQAPRKGICS